MNRIEDVLAREDNQDRIINDDGTAFDGRYGPVFVAIGFIAFLLIAGLFVLVS